MKKASKVSYKILKIKDFLKETQIQFDVILRGTSGVSLEIYTYPNGNITDGIKHEIKPPSETLGIISIVKRISDDQTFQRMDAIKFGDADKYGNRTFGTIICFSEDLIHCVVAADEFESSSKTKILNIPVNNIILEYREDGEGDLVFDGTEGEGIEGLDY